MTAFDLEKPVHPSPHRSKTGLAALLFGLCAGPVAWGVGEVVNVTLAQEACLPGTEPLGLPTIANVHGFQLGVMALSLLISASAAMIALQAWRATRGEHEGGTHTLLAIGEGRSRFMALAGVLTSIGFAVATLFSLPAIQFVSAC
ncbi:hypothetical protein ACO2Q3_09075 [Caulobacter sp. KR2-114]|uniref:hypothetical protein n=1 Tax=Caulobacter sp. KR2-114 TaxID=3400912 RepID=UPI003C090805